MRGLGITQKRQSSVGPMDNKDFTRITRIFISSPGLHVDIWVQIIGLHIEEKQNKTKQKLHLSLYTYMIEYKNQQILIS